MSIDEKFESGWVVVPEVRSLYETAYGVRTHYVTAGEGEPLILVHGGGPGASGASGWFNTIPALAKHFKVYAPDLIGNGQTDLPIMDYSLQTLVEHVAGFIDALKLPKVRIMGNSQGAYVALKYALDNPGRITSTAIISTGSLASGCGVTNKGPDAKKLPHFDGSRDSLRKFLEVIVSDPSKVTEELLDARYRVASRPGHKEMLESLERFRRMALQDSSMHQAYFIGDRMQKFSIPSTMIWGELDQTAPLATQGAGMKALLPHIPFHVVKGSGHQVQNDKVEECNKLLLDHFLAN